MGERRGQRSQKDFANGGRCEEDDIPELVPEKLLVLKMSGSKFKLPLLLRRAGEVRLLGDSGFRGSAEPTQRVNHTTQTTNHSCIIVKWPWSNGDSAC